MKGVDTLAIESVLAGLLLSAATSTAIDVVSQRTIDPNIRRIGQAYRVFGILDATTSVANAIRVAAYYEAASIIANEVFIEAATRPAKKALGEVRHINFNLIRQAENLLIKQDDTDETTMERWKLDPMAYDKGREAFFHENWESCGDNMVKIAWPCVARAVKAAEIVDGIASTYDAAQPRLNRNWDRSPNWIDRINTGLGYAIWIPTPVVGVGSGVIYNSHKYIGVFRRDSPEGYGKIMFSDGAIYKGQIHQKDMGGYGVLRQSDGTVLGGYFCRSEGILGALVAPDRSRVIAGSHRLYGGTFGYARQVGLTENTPSQSGLWRDGIITHPTKTKADHTAELKERFRWVENRYGSEVIKGSEVSQLRLRQAYSDSSISGMGQELLRIFRE